MTADEDVKPGEGEVTKLSVIVEEQSETYRLYRTYRTHQTTNSPFLLVLVGGVLMRGISEENIVVQVCILLINSEKLSRLRYQALDTQIYVADCRWSIEMTILFFK